MITAVKAFTLAFALAVYGAPLVAQTPARPLLVEGRKTVYQRVLTRPDAPRYTATNGAPAAIYPAFQPLYVYAAEPGWYQVGRSISSGPEGWVKADSVVEWKQNIVAAFTNPAGRQRQVLFDTEARLRAIMEDKTLPEMQQQILGQVLAGSVSAETGVVAAEPPVFVNIVDRLYLMPILDFVQDLHPLNYEENLLMKVASVPLREETAATPAKADSFDVGIVFVFDTTSSMEPYISRTQAAVEQVVRDMAGTGIGERVNFGVVAFRDNNAVAPGLEYRTRTLLPLQRRSDQTPVLATIRAATRVASVDSPGFNEDSLAGVEDAVDLTDWNGGGDPFDARIVILITDAGPKEINDPNARSQIGAKELQRAAQDKGVAIMTLHLKTPVPGEAQHAYAAREYRDLSRFNNDTFYYGIENGSPEAFESTVHRLVTAMTDVIREARSETPVLPAAQKGPELVNLGLAMRLAWLGRTQGTEAPDVIEGWVSEKAIEDPAKLAIEPRLLVTKNEMATMADLLAQLLTLGEQARGAEDAASFFTQVRDVVARMAQNPDRLVNTDSNTLGGALEFLEDLPYESQLMLTTEERWAQSAMNRRQILDGMRQKLVQYRKWLLNPDVWTPLFDGAPDGEYVFAMPFDVLP
ncbi:vWA domain-containing protein [Seohaeicola zhoushanensis]|uniref:Serine/threonine protein kinase n=1 Tax=Seohaeicola zhoushanensis TaxID=1569283 RepID=A0A8J3H132_9RHOB|nr:vWA domain-containing protein [Seohaeicola zhoushanensis]GHF63573.1 serine/threonine protein kinase [Seohaeicola zhoushanensis]